MQYTYVNVTIDRPLGCPHPRNPDILYPINYGYVEGILAPDGAEQDVYLLGVDVPVKHYQGAKLIALIHRFDDVEEKWVACPPEMDFTKAQIREQTAFVEQFFRSEVRMLPEDRDIPATHMKNATVEVFRGEAYEMGQQIGVSARATLKPTLEKYIHAADRAWGLDLDAMEKGALSKAETLPADYLEEMRGVADGAGLPIDLLASGLFCDTFMRGCTAFLYRLRDQIWVGRNNDFIAPGIWSQINVLERKDRIPTMLFGMKGDLFAGTGYNAEKLWLHYNYLPAWDTPPTPDAQPPFVWLRQALGCCKTLKDVETLLRDAPRSGGMNLFAADGKSGEGAIYECGCATQVKRPLDKGFIAAANHPVVTTPPQGFAMDPDSVSRQQALENSLQKLTSHNPFKAFTRPLALPAVARGNENFGTVYSCLACPTLDMLWYVCNGLPAPGNGVWERVEWQW